MSKCFALAIVLGTALLVGCSVMEQYHFPQTQDKVPVEVIVAFSESFPNDTIKSITEQKMFDGDIHYKFLIANSKNVERTVAFTKSGQPVKDPL